jgi:3-oxoacyl-[acyl-carrier protein] reductase
MSDKRFLVVGGSSGIGASLIQLLLDQGHEVINWSRRSAEIANPNLRSQQLDILSDSPLPLLDGPIHGLVYCPGSIQLKPFHRFTKADFQADWEINFMGAVRSVQHLLPNLKEGQGSVVLFSTVAVQTGMSFHSSIAGAKGAVEGLTRSLAAELAPGIRVNCIAPSLTQTPLAEKLLNTPEKQEAGAARHPLKKFGKPEDLAELASFLLSDKAGWITGQIIHADGGLGQLR